MRVCSQSRVDSGSQTRLYLDPIASSFYDATLGTDSFRRLQSHNFLDSPGIYQLIVTSSRLLVSARAHTETAK